jgi:hypothetical protein
LILFPFISVKPGKTKGRIREEDRGRKRKDEKERQGKGEKG